MSAKWQINGTDIYVSKEEISRELKRAEIFILGSAGSSVFHYFGAGSRKYSIEGLVIGETNRNTIENTAINNTSFTLVTPWASIANCKIDRTPKFVAKMYSGATIGGTVYTVDSTPLFDCSLELIVTA